MTHVSEVAVLVGASRTCAMRQGGGGDNDTERKALRLSKGT